MAHFTPWSALAGGLLIGLAAALLWVSTGRVAGISGILGNALMLPRADGEWAQFFLFGLAAGGLLWGWLAPGRFEWGSPGHPVMLGVAGLLVGVGTRIGGGCTSGHGLCGLSRLSGRSAVATAIFMGIGMGAVFLVHRALGGHS